jgi:hypothetical protein
MFPDGDFHGTPEDAFRTSATVYLRQAMSSSAERRDAQD